MFLDVFSPGIAGLPGVKVKNCFALSVVISFSFTRALSLPGELFFLLIPLKV